MHKKDALDQALEMAVVVENTSCLGCCKFSEVQRLKALLQQAI
jgi:hypothetical protein